ncbi:MAG TPA: pyrroloquinoline quinone-dependent dehydrogenase [Allosphingosinicella sp.]|jgi:quinoprotein glucose dehydrogenase
MRRSILAFACLASASAAFASPADTVPDGDWPAYGRTAGGNRLSPLRQIHRGNVGRLEVAWRFRTGDGGRDRPDRRPARFSATPIAIDGRLYLATPFGRVVALDGATGREIWSFDARVDDRIGFGDFVSRGVSWWRDETASAGAPCASRIFAGIVDGRLIALDAASGRLCGAFGSGGTIDLRQGLRNPPSSASEYELTSPPAVIGNVVVVGSAVADNNRLDAASGEVRAFDARSGRLLWSWDPVPQDARDPAYGSWRGPASHRTGAANTWSVIAADPARDMVFLPTSSPSPDYWGGARLGDNRHANSIVALQASTGRLVWSFQTVHHDLWDYDNAAPPALVDMRVGRQIVPAVIQATKSGQLFILDRRTGRPLFPVSERAVPASDARGETAAATQPFSALPALSPLRVTEDDIRRASDDPSQVEACLALFRRLRHDGPFTPPSERGSLISPSNIGGAHWGGVVYDPASGAVIAPVNRIASVVTLLPRESAEAARAGDAAAGERIGLEYTNMRGSPYVMKRELFAARGRLCTPAPHGSLHAISLRTGRTMWNVPLGTSGGALARLTGTQELGFINLGGPLLTETGLLFIGAAPDAQFRAFDARTGRALWEHALPAGARATPMTYRGSDGRQYVVIAAAGDGELFGRSDELIAFALPGR